MAKLLLELDHEIVDKIFVPQKLLELFLDEIKLKKLAPTIKGGIWYIIGILYDKIPILLIEYKRKINDIIFYELKTSINNSKKLEIKLILGILKGYLYILNDFIADDSQIESLYIIFKNMIKPLPNSNSIKINKSINIS
jgi:hypothetical protein